MWKRAPSLLAAIAVTAVAGVGVASAVMPSTSSPPDAEAPDELTPKPGSETLERTVGDPKDGRSYGVEVSKSKTGKTCLSAGEMQRGKVNGSKPKPPSESCGTFGGPGGDRALVGAVSEGDRLIIHGVAGPDVAHVTVGGEAVPLSAKRAYIAVREGGQADLPKYPVVVTLTSGATVTYPWNDTPTTAP